MEKAWKCKVCGYIHKGDSPPDVCPVCGVGPEFFELVDENPETTEAAGKEEPKIIPVNNSLDMDETIRQGLFRISYGLFIITAHADGIDNGQCANTCFQITSTPPRIAVAINKQNYTHELIEKSGKFGVSILHQKGLDYVRRFGFQSGRKVDKFAGIKVHRGRSGVLLLDDVLVTLEATVCGSLDAGTHTLYLADVTSAEILHEGEPMTYAYYRANK